MDTAKVEKLTNKNVLESLQKGTDKAERNYSQALRENEERLKILEDQKSKIDQLQDSLQRLKEICQTWNLRIKYFVNRPGSCQQAEFFQHGLKQLNERWQTLNLIIKPLVSSIH